MPDRATLKAKDFARRLLASEPASGKPATGKDSVPFRVCEKLREPLGKLVGLTGYCSLMSRSLTRASGENPWMCALHIRADGSLGGVEEFEGKLDSRSLAEGEAVLVSKLLGLLLTFIGPTLTLQLLQDIWPKLETLDSDREEMP